MKTGTTVGYAERRTNEHLVRFNRLYDEIVAGHPDESWLTAIESQDNIFPDIDYRIYAT